MKEKKTGQTQAAAGQKVLHAMRRLMEEMTGEDPLQEGTPSDRKKPPADTPIQEPVDLKPLLMETATGLWRLRQGMVDRTTGEPLAGMQQALRRVGTLLDMWEAHGFFLRDHTGEVLPDSGAYGLKVITYEPTQGLQQETVLETVRPTILFRDDVLQMGEVVVGIPLIEDPEAHEDRGDRGEDQDRMGPEEARETA